MFLVRLNHFPILKINNNLIDSKMFKFRFGKKSPKGQSGDIDFEESKETLESNLVQPSNRKSDDIKLKQNLQSD